MIGDIFVYNIIRVFMLVLMIACGKVISTSKNKDNTVIFTIIVIIAFSLVEGLRWDRGPDYYNNYLLLTTNDLGVTKSEPLFNAIIGVLKGLSVPYWGCFIFYSFLYIFAYTKVVKLFPKTAVWALPIMFFTTVGAHENFVRQFIAISFVLLAYYYNTKNKNLQTVICLLCAVLNHYSGLFAVFLFYLIKYVKLDNFIKRPILLVFIYLALYFFWDISYLNSTTEFLNSINIGESSMQNYLDNADRWFTSEGSLSDLKGAVIKTSFLNEFFTLATNCIIIYFGFFTMQNDKRMCIPYWFTYFAIIIFVLGGDIELYQRFAWWLYYFMPIVLGAIWYLTPMKRTIKVTMMSIIVLNYIYRLNITLSTIPSAGYAFIWDR